MRPYEERKAARIARLLERAEGKRAESARAFSGVRQIADAIPFGQPILVGHHSERRARKDADRIHNGMRRAIEADKEARDLERRAEAAASNRAISSDDPEAVVLLREKLSKVNKQREMAKSINGAIQKAKRAAAKGEAFDALARANLTALGLEDRHLEILLAPDCFGNLGVPAYRMTNLGAEARRIEKRIEELTVKASAPVTPPELHGDIRIEESENRVRVIFPGKPSEDVRERLKSWGFKWAPSEGAWQRHASNQAWHAARAVVRASCGPVAVE